MQKNGTAVVKLKNGRRCLIRNAVVDDAEGLFGTECAIITAGIGVVQDLDDIPGDVVAYRDRLAERLEGLVGNGILVVAELSSDIVGYVQIERLAPARVRHVAELNIGVHPKRQGIGIGKALLRIGMERIRHLSDPAIERIELGVDVTNFRARCLYSEFGFVVEGYRRDFHRTPSGENVDDIMMAFFPGKN